MDNFDYLDAISRIQDKKYDFLHSIKHDIMNIFKKLRTLEKFFSD